MSRTLGRSARRRAALYAAAVLAPAIFPAVSGSLPPARADEVTASQDLLRTGWDRGEPALTPAAVSGSGFGQLFSTAVLVAGVSKPHAPFGTPFPIVRGLPVNAGDDLKLRITFRPAHAGKFHGVYTFTWTDRSAPMPFMSTSVAQAAS